MATTFEYLQKEKREEILALAQKYGVENIRVFGSVVRGEDGPGSDIDFLINQKDGLGLCEWFDFWGDLESLLGKEVDVVREKNLHWFLKPQILKEARPL